MVMSQNLKESALQAAGKGLGGEMEVLSA